jgi:hypothetical protein
MLSGNDPTESWLYSPIHRKRLINVMLLKKSGGTHLGGLRTIVLFPIDYNIAFKHMGRRMVQVAEETNSLSKEQYRSCRNNRAKDLSVNKALRCDLLW